MTLEELVRKRFLQDDEITRKLAEYANSPAIFLQRAPGDTEPGWDRRTQYPRIVNTVELRTDPERKCQGTLATDLYCDLLEDAPEDIEPLIRESLKNIVVKPDGDSAYAFAWQRTDVFEFERADSDKRIAGYRILFDIMEFPSQITTDPDPVLAMNDFLKGLDGSIFLIGYDEIGELYEATNERPAVYVSATAYCKRMETFALVYIDVDLSIHVLAPSAEYRRAWARALYNELFRRGEIPYTDGMAVYPMLIDDIRTVNTADYMRQGQIQMKCMYTMLSARIDREDNPLNKLTFDTEGGESTDGNGN